MSNQNAYVDALLERANTDQLSLEDINYVEHQFEKSSLNDPNLSKWIYILGITGSIQYRPQVEKYLLNQDNDWVCVQALRTLCSFWGLTSDYLTELKMFIKGVEWDSSDFIAIYGFGIAGRYLVRNDDDELLKILIDIFENLDKSEPDILIQAYAYQSIAQAMGVDLDNIPEAEDIEESILSGKNLDLTLVEKAKQRIHKVK